MKDIKCKRCNRNLNDLTLIFPQYQYCNKCIFEERTDLDRTGRSSKKDKYKNKNKRDYMY